MSGGKIPIITLRQNHQVINHIYAHEYQVIGYHSTPGHPADFLPTQIEVHGRDTKQRRYCPLMRQVTL